jgi:hypothetical protein
MQSPNILDFRRFYEVLALIRLLIQESTLEGAFQFPRWVPSDKDRRHLRDSPEDPVKQLIAYLLDHAMLDFSGELTIEMVKEFLRGDEAPESRALLNKIMQDGGVEDMQVTLADCLQDALRTGLTEGVVGEQLKLYAES